MSQRQRTTLDYLDRLFDGALDPEDQLFLARRFEPDGDHHRPGAVDSRSAAALILQPGKVGWFLFAFQGEKRLLSRVFPYLDRADTEALCLTSRWLSIQASTRLTGTTSLLFASQTSLELAGYEGIDRCDRMIMQHPNLTNLKLREVNEDLPYFLPKSLRCLDVQFVSDEGKRVKDLMVLLRLCPDLKDLKINCFDQGEECLVIDSFAALPGLENLTLICLDIDRFDLSPCATTLKTLDLQTVVITGEALLEQLKSCTRLRQLDLFSLADPERALYQKPKFVFDPAEVPSLKRVDVKDCEGIESMTFIRG